MIAEKNSYIAEAAQSLYEAHADEVTEMQCRARCDYYKQKNTTEKIMREPTPDNKQLHARIKELEAELAQQTKKAKHSMLETVSRQVWDIQSLVGSSFFRVDS